MQCVDLGGRRIIKKIFFKQKTAYEISLGLVGSEMCIRDRGWTVFTGSSGDRVFGGLQLKSGAWSFVSAVYLSLIHI